LIAEVQTLLRRYGYDIKPTGVADGRTEFVVTAFQRHFRPARVDGRLDQSTITTLERLIAALPPPLTS
jgi:N-acetylmuramoyl-L-alanine amidase